MRDRALEFLRQIVEIDTCGKNESKCIEKILELFKEYEFNYKIIKSDVQNRDSLVIEVGNLKSEKNNIAFIGHLDTVACGDIKEWKYNPFKGHLEGDLYYGRGTSDMKGGVVSMLLLLQDILEKKIQPGKKIVFIFTSDEEDMGIGMKAVNKEKILDDVKTIIVPEPTNLEIGVSEKGALWLEVEIKGKNAHASMPEKGINSIDMAFKFYSKLTEFIDQYPIDNLLGRNTIAMTQINSGYQTNIIPNFARFTLDLRLSTLQTSEVIKASEKIKDEIQNTIKDCKIEIKILNNRKLLREKCDLEILEKLKKYYIENNMDFKPKGITYYTDLSQVENIEDKNFLIIGPGFDYMAHQTDECVSLKNIETAYQVFTKII